MNNKKKKAPLNPRLLIKRIVCILSLFTLHNTTAQVKRPVIHLAKIVVDSAQLESYMAFGKEEIETSLRVEPGVLVLYAVAEKKDPTHITILEIYSDTIAYRKHLKTPHFLKYKNGTIKMVRNLELADVDPLVPGAVLKQVIDSKVE